MEFLFMLRLKNPNMLVKGATPEESAIIDEHFEYLKTLTAQNVVYLAGRTLTMDERTFGIVIFESGHENSAKQIMENDPAVKKNLMSAELFPFHIALMRSK
ncbi:MAG: hypothetical protein JW855_01420 [Gammaproteobacteria bacterium]|nr:hypothetical protein [Gammaproteobacteria bacterium]